MFVWICWLCCFGCVIGPVSTFVITTRFSMGSWLGLCAGLCFFSLPVLLRLGLPPKLLAPLVGLLIAGLFTFIGLTSRGLHTTSYKSILAMPLLGFLLGGVGTGLTFIGLGMTSVLGLYVIHISGIQLKSVATVTQLHHLQAFIFLLLLPLFGMILWFYDSSRKRAVSVANEALADLAEAKELAESANTSKSTFLANVSHELRTPLNAIIGYAELLREESLEEGRGSVVNDAEKIRTAGEHLLSLINDLLDISKIEAQKLKLDTEPFSIDELLQEVVLLVEPMIDKNDNTLETMIQQNIGLLEGDRLRIKQILLNLLSNAAKFTVNGTVTLKAQALDKDGTEWLSLCVEDTGIGMSMTQKMVIFQPYEQAKGTSQKFGGTGLGLSLTQKLCEMMGGSIKVTSQPELGSQFLVMLPRKPLV